MKRKYVLAILVAVVLFLLYSRRVSGLDASSCTPNQHWSTLTGSCLEGAPTTNVAVTTKTTAKGAKKR
jgi:hypothetical protein